MNDIIKDSDRRRRLTDLEETLISIKSEINIDGLLVS